MRNGGHFVSAPMSYPCYGWVWNIQNILGELGQYINGLVQEKRNSIANALELRLSCTDPSTCTFAADNLAAQVISKSAATVLTTKYVGYVGSCLPQRKMSTTYTISGSKNDI